MLPADPDDQADMRLQALRIMADAQTEDVPGDPTSRFYRLTDSKVQALYANFDEMVDQLRPLEDAGALRLEGYDPRYYNAYLTQRGFRWARHGDGQDHKRRRRRILRYMYARSRPTPGRITRADIASGLGIDELDVARTWRFCIRAGTCQRRCSLTTTPIRGKPSFDHWGYRLPRRGGWRVTKARRDNR